ncbi:hypothetical protein PFTANZ_00981 [Plasmodium falciparum Tanzania (2000708)]|uniref:Plasmodium RESA N-terminal domain-containing protein n=1 Tax=Plasmodium falciparum Tanzania (2000708) TaxID=1036725 RepID=A0A024WCS2_PLAFA|nr:hypothetical protein PFTANZ_00981 [Plasmodium falciparum Tanzania (2000708)]
MYSTFHSLHIYVSRIYTYCIDFINKYSGINNILTKEELYEVLNNIKKSPPKNELMNLRHQSFNILLNQEHTLDNIKNYKFSYIVTFEEMKQKLGNIYKTKFQHIVQNPKKYYKKDFY